LNRLSLSDVALRAVTSIAIPETLWAMARCLEQADFGSVALLTDQERPAGSDPQIDWQRIEQIHNREDYSEFILRKLVDHVDRPHVLIVQWDGFITNTSCWTEEFLNYDYIGAPWPQFADGRDVGNGGFSLRSKRLIELTASLDFPPGRPEDIAICRDQRTALEGRGVRFAPRDLAERFSFERGPRTRSFGFHGLFNFPLVLRPDELGRRLDELDPVLLAGRDGADLLVALAGGDLRQAWHLAGRRVARNGWSTTDLLLRARMATAVLRGGLGS
jgi:hypothetical protein